MTAEPARKPAPWAKQALEHTNFRMRLPNDTVERIDAVRGPLSRVEWIRLTVQAVLADHPMLRHIPEGDVRKYIANLPSLGGDLDKCSHPEERIHRGLCGRCGQFVPKDTHYHSLFVWVPPEGVVTAPPEDG